MTKKRYWEFYDLQKICKSFWIGLFNSGNKSSRYILKIRDDAEIPVTTLDEAASNLKRLAQFVIKTDDFLDNLRFIKLVGVSDDSLLFRPDRSTDLICGMPEYEMGGHILARLEDQPSAEITVRLESIKEVRTRLKALYNKFLNKCGKLK